ncbi:MAG: hypothetical protein M1825_000438 [Sarcosagium campestre]|nr:MAG: hypothetical protein M1825_000438 [Sarcosagium campestre]
MAARLEHRRQPPTVTSNDYESIWNSTAYQQYRARQKKSDGLHSADSVWPDHLEESFKAALALIPPIGRRKLPKNGKPCGRNELIVDYILLKNPGTKGIGRKQVSSHIQVLKGFMSGNRDFMKLVKPRRSNDERPFHMSPQLKVFLAGGDPDSILPAAQSTLPSQQDLRGPLPILGDSLTSTPSNPKELFRPLNFVMWVQPPDQDHVLTNGIHTYTSLGISSPLPTMPLESVYNWRSSFPHLASLHHTGAVGCEITYLESSLNMPNSCSPLTGWVLGTQLEVVVPPSYDGYQWHCVTHMYCPRKEPRIVEREVQRGESGSDGGTRLHLHFAPNFWAETFVDMAEERRKLWERNEFALAEEKVLRHVRNISVVQELFATIDGEGSGRKRMGIFLWNFKGTTIGEPEAKTTWRNLIPPPSRILTNSPAPPQQNTDSIGEILWDQGGGPALLNSDLFQQTYQHHDFQLPALSPVTPGPASPSEPHFIEYPGRSSVRMARGVELGGDLYYPHQREPGLEPYTNVEPDDSYPVGEDGTYHSQSWQDYVPPSLSGTDFGHIPYEEPVNPGQPGSVGLSLQYHQ